MIDWSGYMNDFSESVFGFGILRHAQATPVTITIAVVITVLMVIGCWRIFEKAGEAGWKCLIPFLNTYLVFKLGWGYGWLFLLGFVPYLGPIMLVIGLFYLARSFGKSGGFCVGFMLFPYIFMPILGFSDAQYQGPSARRR